MCKINQRFKRKNFIKGVSKCSYCGEFLILELTEVDHILPKSKGGSSRLENLTLSCEKCNGLKSNFTLTEWRLRIEGKLSDLKKTIDYYNSVLGNI